MSVPTATPVYTLGAWQGNVLDDYGVDWVVETEEGWSSSPAVRPTQEDKTSGDGAWTGPGYYGVRVVQLAGKAIANDRLSMLAAKERIRQAAGPRSLTALRVDEAHMSRQALVRLTDQITITDLGPIAFDWAMILSAPDPRRYSVDSLTQWTGLPFTAGGGRTYPRTYPYTYGGAIVGAGGSVSFTQEGDYDQTGAVIVFHGPVTSPGVEHVQSGRSLTFDLVLAAEETLVVDLAAQTAMAGGSASRIASLTTGSSWFLLQPGENELVFSGMGGAVTLARATAQSTAATPDYLPATDADAADIQVGSTVQLRNASDALKEPSYFQVTRTESAGGITNIFFAPNALAVVAVGDYLQAALPDWPRMTVTASSAWT